MDVKTLLKEKRKVILPAITDLVNEKKEEWVDTNKWAVDVLDRLEPYMSNGKMVRGAFVLWTAELFGATQEQAMPAALAVELLQAALLMHDDVMDQDDTRRGMPSLHKQYELVGDRENIDDAQHFGASMAICAGDIALFLAYEVLSKTQNASLVQVFSQQTSLVGLGQMQDIYMGVNPSLPEFDDVLKMYEHKTARYTFCLPFLLGGLVAGQEPEVLVGLEDLGKLLGRLFQVKDDWLGLYGKHEEVGKTIGVDILTGKKTVYYTLLWPQLIDNEKKQLVAMQSLSQLQEVDMEFVLDLVEKYGVKQKVDELIKSLQEQSLAAIDKLDVLDDGKSMLRALLAYIVEREK